MSPVVRDALIAFVVVVTFGSLSFFAFQFADMREAIVGALIAITQSVAVFFFTRDRKNGDPAIRS